MNDWCFNVHLLPKQCGSFQGFPQALSYYVCKINIFFYILSIEQRRTSLILVGLSIRPMMASPPATLINLAIFGSS